MNTKQPTTEKESPPEISDFITIIRPQFMRFCKDACRAATLNHMLFRIAWKCKNQLKAKIQAGDVLWYAKNEQITSEMSNAWGVCKVRQEVNALIGMNLIGRKKNPAWGADRTKHFCFGSEQCAVFLKHCEDNNICVVHLDLPVEVRHLIYSSVANDKSIKCSCEKGAANDKSIECKSYNHQMETIEVSDGNDKSIEAIPKNTTKTTTEEHYEEEGTFPPDHDDSGALAPTTPAFQDDPIATTSTEGHDDTHHHGNEDRYTPSHPARGVGDSADLVHGGAGEQAPSAQTPDARIRGHAPETTRATSEVAPDSNGYENTDEDTVKRPAVSVPAQQLSTSIPQSGKVSARTERPARTAAPRAFARSVTTAQLTLEGAQIYDWYCIIRACKLRRTPNVVNACNNLVECDGMSFENLKRVLDHYDDDKWMKNHGIVVDLQELEKPDGKYTFERGLQAVKNKEAKAHPREQKQTEPPINDYSFAALLAERPLPPAKGATR